MAQLHASVPLVSLFGLIGAAALCGCGAATDQPALDGQTRDATGSESDDGDDTGDGTQAGDGDDTDDGTQAGDGAPALDRATALTATWHELGLPGVSNGPDLTSSPSGWLSLSQRSIGDPKAPSAWESYLYRSADGVHWQSVPVSEQNDNLWLRGVAYGAGHYVLAGRRMGENDGALFHSTDGERWQETTVATGAPSGLADVVFAGGQFFALSTNTVLLRSTNGVDWQAIQLATTVMPQDVAFGGGQFLLVGSGNVQLSSDGQSWQPSRLECNMPGACITDPSGNVSQGFHTRAVFAAGTYFIDQASSADGVTWQSLPGLYPAANVAGSVVGTDADNALALWAPGEAAEPLHRARYVDTLSPADRAARMRWNGAIEPSEQTAENFPNGEALPERVEFPLPSGADCTSATCVTAGNRIYLLSPRP